MDDVHVEVDVPDGQRADFTEPPAGIEEQADDRGVAELDEFAALAVIE
jgi:hypothetical protein